MKNLVFALSAAIMFSTSAFAGDPVKETASVKNDKSTVIWTGEKVTGYHTGNLSISSGELNLDGDKITSATVVLDMTSITCTDIEDSGTNAKLVGHLKSPDFFDVENHTTAEFELTSFTPKKSENANYLIEGNLTIKGITHPISFPAYVVIKDGVITADAEAIFDRSLYEIKFRSGSFFENLGDKMIYDDVKVAFRLYAELEG